MLRGEEDSSSWRSAILLEGFGEGPSPYWAIRTESYKYVEYDNGERELYNLEADPYELDNIYESADSSLVEDLKTKLEVLESCSGAGCREAEDTP